MPTDESIYYKLMFATPGDIITRQDVSGKLLYISDSCLDTLGYTPEELIGNQIYDLFHKDDLLGIEKTYSLIHGTQTTHHGKCRLKQKNSEYLDVEIFCKMCIPDDNAETGTHEIISVYRIIQEKTKDASILPLIKTAVEKLTKPVIITGLSNKIIYHNKSFVNIFGYDAETINQSDGILNLFADESVFQDISSKIHEGRNWHGMADIKDCNNNIHPVHLNIDPIIDCEGEIQGFIGIFLGLSELNCSEAKEEGNNRDSTFHLIAELLSDFIFKFNLEDNDVPVLDFISDNVNRATGYNPVEIPKSGLLSAWPFISTEDKKNVESFCNDTVLKKSGSYTNEFRINHKNGDIKWLRCHLYSIKDQKTDRIANVIGAAIDITSAKNRELLLAENEKMFRRISNEAPANICMLKNDSILYANHCFCKMVEYDSENITGKSILQFIHPDDRKVFQKNQQQLINSTAPCSEYELNLLADNKKRFKVVFKTCLLDSEDQTTITTINDDQKLQQQKVILQVHKRIIDVIRKVHQMAIQETNLQRFLKQTCKALVKTVRFKNVWIILLDDNQEIKDIKGSGIDMEYFLSGNEKKFPNLPFCAQKCLEYESPLFINEDQKKLCNGCILNSCISSNRNITLKLEHNNTLYAFMGLSSAPEFPLDEQTQLLLQELGDNIAFGIFKISLESKRNTIARGKSSDSESNNENKASSKAPFSGTMAKKPQDLKSILDTLTEQIGLAKMYIEPELEIYQILTEAEQISAQGKNLIE